MRQSAPQILSWDGYQEIGFKWGEVSKVKLGLELVVWEKERGTGAEGNQNPCRVLDRVFRVSRLSGCRCPRLIKP